MPISMVLDKSKCKGCTHCVKQCPTEAIRVRNGIAQILSDKCIDCGQCAKVCPHKAKKVVADSLSHINDFKHSIVLPAPSLYGQFHNLTDADIVLNALLDMGFDEVFEPAAAAEIISDLTVRELEENAFERPVISSACPAVVRLIRQRFPNLIPHISRHKSPVELAATLAKERAISRTGLDSKDIGVFFITPCPAKVTEAHEPLGLKEPVIDYALSMTVVYKKLLPLMKNIKEPKKLRTAGLVGIGWAVTGGETRPLNKFNAVSCNGIKHVIRLLEAVEDEMLPEVDFLELSACIQGCVGGCLTIENPFVARSRVTQLASNSVSSVMPVAIEDIHKVWYTERIRHTPTMILDADFGKAIEKLKRIEAFTKTLPGLDCGSCGTPGCRALAQDVVMGYAVETDCIFNARKMMEAEGDDEMYLPPPFRRKTGSDIKEAGK